MVCKDGGKEPLAISAPTQKAGFGAPKTVISLMEV